MSGGNMDAASRAVLVPEARELLAEMEAALLAMESQGSAPERINAIFRAAHTIKGSAGLFGLDLIVSFTQKLESILERVRNGELTLGAPLVSVLLASCDYIGQLVDAIEAQTEEVDPDPQKRAELLTSFAPLLGEEAALGEEAVSNTSLTRRLAGTEASSGSAAQHWHISMRFEMSIMQSGLDPLSFILYLRQLGTVLYVHTLTDDIPDADTMDPTLCYLGFELGLKTAADRATLEGVFALVRDDSQVKILPPASGVADYIQIIQGLPRSRRKLGEMLVASGALAQSELDAVLAKQAAAQTEDRPRLGEVLVQEQLVPGQVVAAALNRQKQGDERRVSEQRVLKVDATKLDQLINLVGELVIASEGARISAARAQQSELVESMGKVGQIIEQVRDRALDMRMIAIGEVFQRFPRVVRDVSRELGKQIELVITGAESELDKSMVDKLSDPLLHIVRNAIDHGIEPVAERLEAGKTPQGRLHLHAYHESGCIVIEIRDDGRGLDRERIVQKAIERGLLAPDAELSEAEVHQLLFLPGFSTADQVTNLSGRGVGMDVVLRNVEQLRGAIDISSSPGEGTTFRIRLPLTLAIIDGFQVAIGDDIFVIPLETVVECVDMSKSSGKQNLVSLRGEPLPYLRLRDIFHLEPHRGGRESLVVVSHGQQRVGLVVDRLLGDFQAVIKPLGQLFRGIKSVSSSTILGDGTVALILDVATLVARASEMNQTSAVPRAAAH
jgi:two-component system, chemotaxis family, sensor kinase CheA